MANECMDTVVFYAASNDQEKRLIKFRETVESCYGTKMSNDESSLILIFEKNGIPVSDLSIRSDVLYSDFGNGYVTLECVSAWSPPYEAYSKLAKYFGISFVLQAEEPGFSIYYNTDMDKRYLTTQYKVYFAERPEDYSLDSLFDKTCGDIEYYFDSEEELLKWFKECGFVNVKTVEQLKEYLDEEYVCIYEFENPYQ